MLDENSNYYEHYSHENEFSTSTEESFDTSNVLSRDLPFHGYAQSCIIIINLFKVGLNIHIYMHIQ